MGRARDISKVFSTGTALATDSEVSGSYLTQSSASTVYQTKATAGLTLITPASIANTGGTASIGANGTVSFTSASAISLNDVFSATCKNYRVIVEAISAAGEVSAVLRFRVGGADETGNSYSAAVRSLGSNGTRYDGTGSGTNKIFVGRIGGNGRSLLTIDIANPFVTQRTTTVSATAADGTTSFFSENGSGLLFNTTSYTGFTLIPEGSTFSGSLSVFGYNQ